MYTCLHVNCQILIKLQYSREALCTTQISNCMTVRLVAAELFHADRQTDGRPGRQADRQTELTKLIIAFRNSANTHKIVNILYI